MKFCQVPEPLTEGVNYQKVHRYELIWWLQKKMESIINERCPIERKKNYKKTLVQKGIGHTQGCDSFRNAAE